VRILLIDLGPSAPAIAASSEEAPAAAICKLVIEARRLATRKITRGIISHQPSALQHAGIDALLLQLARECDAGNSRADNAHRGDQRTSIRDFAHINQHDLSRDTAGRRQRRKVSRADSANQRDACTGCLNRCALLRGTSTRYSGRALPPSRRL